MRTTEHFPNGRRPLARAARFGAPAALWCLACLALLLMAGCSGGSGGTGNGSTNASAPVGVHMAGAAAQVHVLPAAIENKPKPWVLSTPESAVRSYLDWTNYAYRITTSDVATPTMGPDEAVRVDAHIQLLIEKKQLIDQILTSITFGKASVGSTSTLVPTNEKWVYRYVSTETAGKTVGGPFTASFNATYTVVKSGKGDWVVNSVKATPVGQVK